MDQAERRRKEIEAKKAKLADLRRQREERQNAQQPVTETIRDDRKDVDELVDSLLRGRALDALVAPVNPVDVPVAPIVVETERIKISETEPEPTPDPVPVPEPVVLVDKITYTKGTQTIEEVIEEPETVDILPERIPTPITILPPSPTVPQITIDHGEQKRLLESSEFSSFVDRSSKVLERALNEYDVLYDYTIIKDVQEATKGRLREVTTFKCDMTRNRMITSIDWSPRFPELVLASYNKNLLGPNEPSGVVHVWNLHMSQPEFSFTAQSDIMIARFSPFHPTLIVGGTYSGQIILWDTQTRSAILQTPLSKGHTHPIVGLNIVGSQIANNIISTSSDGIVCAWTMDMLAQPQEVLELISPPPSKVENLSPMSVSFPANDSSTFMVGTEEGHLYSVNRQDRAGSKAGVDVKTVYKGHSAPICGVDHHPAGPIDFSDLVLTSSFDWSIMLWRLKSGSIGDNPPIALLTIEADDAVYDVQWSPIRPGTFAAVTGLGECLVYDLSEDSNVPAARASAGTRSLNKVSWDLRGRHVAVGGLSGELSVYDVGEELSRGESEVWYRLSGKLKRYSIL